MPERGPCPIPPTLQDALQATHIDLQDVLFVLKHGNILKPAELNIRFQEWRYAVAGRPPDGPDLDVIVTFLDEEGTLVLTVMLQ